ncbi:MAG: hypothetical protein K9N51_01230 [Candidatus Pacebacteria bacterium]|nr:hypothetical protein [Candidatus Paceibacterota bacterium]
MMTRIKEMWIGFMGRGPLNAVLELTVILLLAIPGTASGADGLLKSTFEEGAEGWEALGRAELSGVSRRPGHHSLVIRQWADEEAESAWLSPVLKAPGGPVRITFWGAEDYWDCPDISYSASVDVLQLETDASAGKKGLSGGRRTIGLIHIPRDEWRHDESAFRGVHLPTGLKWVYHETVLTPRSEYFQLAFNWPKERVRGDAYLADLVVTAGAVTQADPKPSADGEDESGNLRLEISTPVNGNLFVYDDPLQFEVLVYTRDGDALELPDDLFLEYEVTDYQQFAIASGRFEFKDARPVDNDGFYKSRVGQVRKENVHLPVKLEDAAAREAGRLFFIEMVLTDGERVYAEDTVTYGVIKPRAIDPAGYRRARFIGGYWSNGFYPAWREGQENSVSGKQGMLLEHRLDYGWRGAQPEYPGPYNFGARRPSHPKLIFLPNIEQIRGRPDDHPWGGVSRFAPEGALLPDPLRPGRTTFEIEPYVDYIVNYIRHHRRGIAMVIPSGLERRIDARTVELHKKAYAAIKKEFPDLPVGIMLYGLSEDEIDLFFEEKLYETADFIGNHFYRPSIDWTPWEQIQARYRKLGREPVPLISTEFSRVGGMDQLQRSRDMMVSHLECFSRGLEKIYYYNVTNNSPITDPFLRGATNLGGGQSSGFLYMQRVDRPRVSKEIVCPDPAKRWRRGGGRSEFAGDSIMPILQTMTYYNLIQNFELSEFRETVHPDPRSIVHVFDREDATVAAAWLDKPVGNATYEIATEKPFTIQDLFGRTERIVPTHGKALLTLDENPQVLMFDSAGETIAVSPVESGLQDVTVVRGRQGMARLVVEETGEGPIDLRAAMTVDGTWPDTGTVQATVHGGQLLQIAVPFQVGEERRPGEYSLTARLRNKDGDVFGVLRAPLRVTDPLQVELTGVPVASEDGPAVRILLHNHGTDKHSGTIVFDDRYFADAERNVLVKKRYEVPGGASRSIDIPLNRHLVSLAKSYLVDVRVEDDSGFSVSKREEVSFRGIRPASAPVIVDGDLSDWNLDSLVPVPFARVKGPDVPAKTDLDGSFYAMWTPETLFFAAVIRDDSSVVRADNVGIWKDDNIMLGLYPWGWNYGESLNSGYYREHLGLCADGQARIFRVGAVPGGPEKPQGAAIAVERTADGYVYEWAYPVSDVHPMQLTAGSRFRLSLFVLDRDWVDQDDETVSGLKAIQFGGFNLNVDARPEKWCEFVLVE